MIFEISHNFAFISSSFVIAGEKKMDFCAKTFLYFVLMIANLYCLAEKNIDYPITTSCYIQYLYEKGKVNEPRLPVQPPSRCRVLLTYMKNIFIDSEIEPYARAPNVANCIKNEIVTSDYYDYTLKSSLQVKFFPDGEGSSQFENTTRHLFNLEVQDLNIR